MAKRKWGPTTRNKVIGTLKQAFNWAVDQGIIADNPIRKGRLEWRKDNGAVVQLDRADKETNPWITDELPEGIVGRSVPVTVERVRYVFTPQSTLLIQIGRSVSNFSWAVEDRALSVYSDGGRAALWTAPVTLPRKGEIAIARPGSKPLRLKKLPRVSSP
jgi:hypothetical protein